MRTQLLLDAIADQQETEVSQDELTQQIFFQAQRYGMARRTSSSSSPRPPGRCRIRRCASRQGAGLRSSVTSP